jgi:hypothetical protein
VYSRRSDVNSLMRHMGEGICCLLFKNKARAYKRPRESFVVYSWNDHLVFRIITGGYTSIAYVDAAHSCCFSL